MIVSPAWRVVLVAMLSSLVACSDAGEEAAQGEGDAGDDGRGDAATGTDASDAASDTPADTGDPAATIATDETLACFDSYCPRQSLARIPKTRLVHAGAPSIRAAFAKKILGDTGFLPRIAAIRKSDLTHPTDWEWSYENRVAQKQNWEASLIAMHVALWCHDAFEPFAAAEVVAGRARPDAATLDWKTIPECRAAGQWLAKVQAAWFTYQVMQHSTEPATGGWVPKPWDGYGMWKYGTTYDPVAQWFSGCSWFYPYARYAHLLSAEFLGTSRPRIMAALCALKTASSNIGTYDFEAPTAAASGAQWLLKVDSWVQMTTALLRTEKLLGVTAEATDCAGKGTFSSADALALTEKLTQNTRAYVERFGLSEQHTSYGHVILDALAQMMSTPSSQKVYDDISAVYRSFLWDVGANFSPSSGTVTGPTNRNHDLFMGSHGIYMNFEVPAFVQPYFRPYCDTLASCLPDTPTTAVPKVSAAPTLPYFRTLFAIWQAAGYAHMPLGDVKALTIDRPVRTNVQKAGAGDGADRQHFVAPTYSMGNAGDDASLAAINYRLTARLGGAPNAAYPLTPDDVPSQKDNTFTVGEIRHMLSSTDDPFRRASPSEAPGIGMQLIPRQITAQHQSFMLVTQLATPGSEGSKYGPFDRALSSNLLLPLAVDEIWANGSPLPRALGSATALPENGLITLRLRDASIVIRPIVVERSGTSNLAVVTSNGDGAVVAPGSGAATKAVQWQVDASSHPIGYGKIVYTHKLASDVVNRPYHVAWLWAGGVTRTDAERRALEALVRDAPVKVNTMTSSGIWKNEGNVFVDMYVGQAPLGECHWIIEVEIGGHRLRVDRDDFFHPWGNSPLYRTWNSTPPFYTSFTRTFDDLPTMPPKDWADSDVASFVSRTGALVLDHASMSIGHPAGKYLQPHLE